MSLGLSTNNTWGILSMPSTPSLSNSSSKFQWVTIDRFD